MPSTAPSKSTTATRVARVPYLNSAPYFRGLPLGSRYELIDLVPSELGRRAAAGEITAGLLSVMDYFRLEGTFDRLGNIGIAVRGRARSAILFSVKPIRQLDGAVIAVTEQTSTTLALLRLVLEKRYQLYPAAYERRPYAEQRRENVPPQAAPERRREPDADALLLIGDEALRFRQTNKQYPFETDLAFEWWLWQHLPFVFAVWAVRKDADAQDRKHLEAALMRSLAVNTGQFDAIGQEESARLKMPAEELSAYLTGFVYRLSHAEAEGLKKFRALADEHHLL